MRNTVLERIPVPEVDRQHPVAEDTPCYLQMAFPDVFLTGDAAHTKNVHGVSRIHLEITNLPILNGFVNSHGKHRASVLDP